MRRLREIKGERPLVLRARGTARRKLAELILDLYDLVHMATASSDPVTLDTLERIRGDRDHSSGDRAFYRIQAWLAEHGLSLERTDFRDIPGEPVYLEFDAERVRKLIAPEIAPACPVLQAYRARRTTRVALHRRNAPGGFRCPKRTSGK